MSKIRVAVLRGGPGPAYEDSLKTGNFVISLLKNHSEEYEPLDFFISKGGEWHHEGLADESQKLLSRADVVWNALHGSYGESGEVQKLFNGLQLPFTGSGIAASVFTHNKEVAKEIYKLHSLPTPGHSIISVDASDADLIHIFQSHLHPVIVKPATGVRAVGISLAHTFEELKQAVKRAFTYSPKVLIEEYIRGGTVSTCTVVENAKGERLYALLPAHLETHHRRVRPSPEENRQVEELAKRAHEALGLRHYSSSDFIITPKGKIYILETNSQPVFSEDSLLNHSLESSGWRPYDFVDHCLKLALK